jgi:hypothetical protein
MSLQSLSHNPKYILSLAMSSLLLMLSVGFWYWLVEQDYFVVGCITEVITTGSEYSVIILNSILESSAVAVTQQELAHFNVGKWVLVYGLEYQDSVKLLTVDSFYSNKVVTTLLSVSPTEWLTQLTHSRYLSIIVAGILIISAGRSLQFSYSILVTSFLLVTLWHAGHVANIIGYLKMDGFEFYFLMAIVGFFGLWAYRVHDEHQISSRILVAILSYLYGTQIMTWIGFGSDISSLVLFAIGIWSPVLVSSLFASYLLSKGIGASLVGSYILIVFSYVLSLGLLNSNPQNKYQTAIQQQFKKYAYRTKKMLPKASKLDVKGKVTLAELLNRRNAS